MLARKLSNNSKENEPEDVLPPETQEIPCRQDYFNSVLSINNSKRDDL